MIEYSLHVGASITGAYTYSIALATEYKKFTITKDDVDVSISVLIGIQIAYQYVENS